MKMEIHE